jgi:predicted enzyme related to lactoylglutathione lyase
VSARFDLVTLDAFDAELLVRFWCAALQLSVTETEDTGRWSVLGDPVHPRQIGIQRIAGLPSQEARWEGPSKPRLHLDLACEPDHFATEVERLVDLGAARLRPDRHESYGHIATLADPEGNVFDLCAYA